MKHSLTFPVNLNFMKDDIKQVNDISKKYKMTREERDEFGEFIEKEKTKGRKGTKNDRGDYTYAELDEKANEFLRIKRNRDRLK